MSATTTTSAAILKSQYTQDKVYNIAYKKNPIVGTVRKDEKFVGDFKYIAAQIETPQGGGITVPLAQSHLAPGVYKRFQLTRRQDYALARVSGEALKAAADDDGALLNLWEREMDGAIHTIRRSWAIQFTRNGTGSRGQISAGSNVGTATITLARISDITGFSIGMTLQAAATDGGTLRNAGANIVVTGIDRLNGTLTAAAAWNASPLTAVVAGDFLLREGDNNGVIQGMTSWCPATTITNTLFNNLDRTPDVVRLGGQALNAQGMTLREVGIEAMARIEVEGGDPDTYILHPRDRATLTKEFEGKSIYFKEVKAPTTAEGVAGYDVIEADFDGSRVRVLSDINMFRGDSFITQYDTWGFASLGPAPYIIMDDSLEFLRVYNDDSLEVRVVNRGDLENLAPAYSVHAFNVGS